MECQKKKLLVVLSFMEDPVDTSFAWGDEGTYLQVRRKCKDTEQKRVRLLQRTRDSTS